MARLTHAMPEPEFFEVRLLSTEGLISSRVQSSAIDTIYIPAVQSRIPLYPHAYRDWAEWKESSRAACVRRNDVVGTRDVAGPKSGCGTSPGNRSLLFAGSGWIVGDPEVIRLEVASPSPTFHLMAVTTANHASTVRLSTK
jgi:hypothetical protein